MNYIITPHQVRAARALLDWSQGDLAYRAGVTQTTVANFEVGKHVASPATMKSLIDALQSANIEFIAGGVRVSRGIQELVGDDAVLRLFEDIYFVLGKTKGELLIAGADERQNRAGLELIVRKIRNLNIRFKVLIEEGNEYFLGPIEEYRHVPSKYFYNNPVFVYADKTGIVVPSALQDRIFLFTNAALADSQRRLFNFMWDNCKPIVPLSKKNIANTLPNSVVNV